MKILPQRFSRKWRGAKVYQNDLRTILQALKDAKFSCEMKTPHFGVDTFEEIAELDNAQRRKLQIQASTDVSPWGFVHLEFDSGLVSLSSSTDSERAISVCNRIAPLIDRRNSVWRTIYRSFFAVTLPTFVCLSAVVTYALARVHLSWWAVATGQWITLLCTFPAGILRERLTSALRKTANPEDEHFWSRNHNDVKRNLLVAVLTALIVGPLSIYLKYLLSDDGNAKVVQSVAAPSSAPATTRASTTSTSP